KSGYMDEDYIKKLAGTAGFRFDAESPINNNPKDTKDYPEGVWTLPPTLALGDKDRDKYLAIGETDRMTLRFVKPGRQADHGTNHCREECAAEGLDRGERGCLKIRVSVGRFPLASNYLNKTRHDCGDIVASMTRIA